MSLGPNLCICGPAPVRLPRLVWCPDCDPGAPERDEAPADDEDEELSADERRELDREYRAEMRRDTERADP